MLKLMPSDEAFKQYDRMQFVMHVLVNPQAHFDMTDGLDRAVVEVAVVQGITVDQADWIVSDHLDSIVGDLYEDMLEFHELGGFAEDDSDELDTHDRFWRW